MVSSISYSRTAVQDLRQIGDYIAVDLSNPAAALNTVTKIQNTIDKLTVFPYIGTPVSALAEIETDYRLLVCGKYLAFYHVRSDNVVIDRILHGKRDYITILFGNLTEEEIDEE